MASLLRLPILRAVAAQVVALGVVVGVARQGWIALPPLGWMAVESGVAAWLGRLLGLAWWWLPINAMLPWALHLALGSPVPGEVYLIGLGAMALVFGGGLISRVPLYNANETAWRALEKSIPEDARTFVDLGCGLGGPLAHLARTRPDLKLVGVEASPLTLLVAWSRCLPYPQVRIRWGTLWRVDLGHFDVAYAFLSPAPMPALW